MRKAVGFPGTSSPVEREDGALSNEVRGGVILVQICEDWCERLARVKLLGGRRILGLHIHHEVGVFRKQSHLTFRIAAIGAVCVRFDEFSDGEPIRGFVGGDRGVFAHEVVFLLFRSPTKECKRGKRRAALPPRMARLSKSFNSELCKICCLAFIAKSRRRYGNRIHGRNRC